MTTPATRRLSKSRLVAWRQCPKRLWLETNRRDLLEISPETQRQFDQGHRVGEVARALVPDGILIDTGDDWSEALRLTNQLLNDAPSRPIFEATFAHQGVLVRTDLLIPESVGYRLVEIKSSTSVKAYYPDDCAIQAWAVQGAGITLSRVELAYIDSGFVYETEGDYRGLFKYEDMTIPLYPLLPQVPVWAAQAQTVLSGEMPQAAVGRQCTTPYECPFIGHCTPPGPEYPVTLLPRGGKVAAELMAEGYADLREVPEGRLTNPSHERVRRVTANGVPELELGAADLLCALPYPRHYLDFETIQFAVPIWLGTSPYEQLPFQWSCHVECQDGQLNHAGFLSENGFDPTRAFCESLIGALADDGPIFVYSAFERTRLVELANRYPDLAAALAAIIDRLIDLLPIVRTHYYHPAMRGSYSIKSVLPTIAPDLDYAELEEVQDGGGAQQAFLELLDPTTTTERRSTLTGALQRYCSLDTLAMVRIVNRLQSQ